MLKVRDYKKYYTSTGSEEYQELHRAEAAGRITGKTAERVRKMRLPWIEFRNWEKKEKMLIDLHHLFALVVGFERAYCGLTFSLESIVFQPVSYTHLTLPTIYSV
eukprot:TRINITY_DN12627_c0_g1_i1.p1 TRINITY_DN12627_c0_g1~~TRINITY_DN12627_c0_g1_i1.p1  ORF type:complete len:105 (-),score=19.86 TRINITY_DN12627_c0_g1_i1:31-345(-)